MISMTSFCAPMTFEMLQDALVTKDTDGVGQLEMSSEFVTVLSS